MDSVIKELKERGLLSQTFGNLEECLSKPTTFYIGLDPTADSLGVHHLVGLMAAKILQKHGHRPIILVGGATCAIGDPSGKSEERNTISMETVFHNVDCVKQQIAKIINFDDASANGAIMVNNWDWYKDYHFLDFIRDVGKKITVNYLMAKENVKKRLERDGAGISFQEFSYGLLQGYDFVHLYQTYNCRLQIAGTDNLGNMVTGSDLIHKMLGCNDACGLTWDLLTCADGRKFGKTEGNSVWLDPKKTSPYQFMQFWINQSDEDAERFIKIFTDIPVEELNTLIETHRQNPSARLLQKTLAEYMTCLVHSKEEYNKALKTANTFFGNGTDSDLTSLDCETLESGIDGVTKIQIGRDTLDNGLPAIELAVLLDTIPSKGEARKLIKNNGFSVNKQKVHDEKKIFNTTNLLYERFMVLQKGRKEYVILEAK